MRYQISAWIEQHKDELIEELRNWVRIRSVSDADSGVPGAPFGPECDKMLQYALKRAQDYGFDVENHDGYCGSIYLGKQEDQIGFIAHLDVVPEGNNWKYPPYGGTLVADDDGNQYVISRGADDNKSMGVAGLFLLRCLRDIEAPLNHQIRILLGVSEETGMADARYLVDSGMKLPVVTLVADGGFPVCYGQKGRITAEIELDAGSSILSFDGGTAVNAVPDRACALVREIDPISLQELHQFGILTEEREDGIFCTALGIAKHAARPDGSENAIVKLARALLETRCLNESSLQAMRAIKNLFVDNDGTGFNMAYEDKESGKLTLIGGTIRSRRDPKTGRVMLTQSLDCRYPVTADPTGLRVDLCIAVSHAGGTLKSFTLEPAFFMPESDPRIACLTKIYRGVTGDMTTPNYTMGGGTYSHVIPNAITFGPGGSRPALPESIFPENHGGAHAPDEACFIPSLIQAMQIYAEAILALDANPGSV